MVVVVVVGDPITSDLITVLECNGCVTSIRTRTLAINTNAMLNAKSSSNDKARQPFSLHSSTAKRYVKDSRSFMINKQHGKTL